MDARWLAYTCQVAGPIERSCCSVLPLQDGNASRGKESQLGDDRRRSRREKRAANTFKNLAPQASERRGLD